MAVLCVRVGHCRSQELIISFPFSMADGKVSLVPFSSVRSVQFSSGRRGVFKVRKGVREVAGKPHSLVVISNWRLNNVAMLVPLRSVQISSVQAITEVLHCWLTNNSVLCMATHPTHRNMCCLFLTNINIVRHCKKKINPPKSQLGVRSSHSRIETHYDSIILPDAMQRACQLQ